MFRFFEKLIDPVATPEGVTPPSTTVAFYWHFVRQHKGLFGVLVLIQFALASLDAAMPVFVGMIVNRLAGADPARFFADNGLLLTTMVVVVLVLRPVTLSLQFLVSQQAINPGFSSMVRWQSHWHVVRQSWPFFQADFAGRIANKVMQVGYAMRSSATTIVNIVLYIAIYGVGALLILFTQDWRLAVPMVIWLGMYAVLLRHFVPRIGETAKVMSESRSTLTGRIVDSYTNILTVKLFAKAADEDAFVRDALIRHTELSQQQGRMVTGFIMGLAALNALLIATISGVAIWLWSEGTVSIGTVATAIPFALQLAGMAGWLGWELMEIFENIGVTEESMGVIAKPIAITDRANARELVVSKGEITFHAASFGYGRDSSVINELDLTIRPGEKIGLIGRSGAGKSTLVNLLLRFYDLEKGTITIDGQDIAGVTQESLRAGIAMVTQDTSLLHRSVAANIRYGRPSATDAEIEAAARQAEAHDFIMALEDWKGRKGYDAHVGERGVKLSGGQRQRVAIARVILKNAPILVLDEATSALDSEVEAAIQEQLTALMDGKTVIAIAHRLSTIARMDRLVVIDQGRIIEQGSHAELLAKGGHYAELWARQSGGFIVQPKKREEREAAE
ncbi:MAG: ABC transporter ATP-binding protein [Beijerinckiaceae bacterium]